MFRKDQRFVAMSDDEFDYDDGMDDAGSSAEDPDIDGDFEDEDYDEDGGDEDDFDDSGYRNADDEEYEY